MILEDLPARDIKQIRLVCKALETLSVGKLFTTLFISPREADMVVFDAITQRPDLNGSINFIGFENARFIQEPTKETYFHALSSQLRSEAYAHFRATNTNTQRILSLMDGPHSFERCCQDSTFRNGYMEYVLMAREHRNLFSQSWFARVLQGLKALGPIRSACFINTFDIYFEIDMTNGGRCEAAQSYPCTEAGTDGHKECHHIEDFGSVHKRPIGSPSARSWSFSHLQPTDPTLDKRENLSTLDQTPMNSLADGSVELIRAVELLKLADKAPSVFTADYQPFRHEYLIYGLPSQAFAVQHWWGRTKFADICQNLSILEIQFASSIDMVNQQSHELHQLKHLFQSSPKLIELKLALPTDEPSHQFQDVFPPITGWEIPSLRRLDLEFVSTTYKDIVGLLFGVFPILDDLTLGQIQLSDGNWESIMEGLRTSHSLQHAFLNGLEYADARGHYPVNRADLSTDEYCDFMDKLSDYISQGPHVDALNDLLKKGGQLSMDLFTATYKNVLALRSKRNHKKLGMP